MKKHWIYLLLFIFLAINIKETDKIHIVKTCFAQTLDDHVLMDNVHELALRPDGKEIWVYSMESHAIVIVNIETEDYQIVGDLKLPGHRSPPMCEIIFSPDSRYAYIAHSLQCVYEESCENWGDLHYVIVVDAEKKEIVSTIPMKERFSPLPSFTITHDGKYLYLPVTDESNGIREGIYKLDLQSHEMVNFLEVPDANFITLSPDGRYIYCTRGWYMSGPPPNLFSIIDTDSLHIISSVSTGSKPVYAAITPNGEKAYVSNQLSNDVTVIDLLSNQIIKTITVGKGPVEIAITPDGSKAYVGNSGLGGETAFQPGTTVSVIDVKNDTLIKNIQFIKDFRQICLEMRSIIMGPDGKKAYVSDGNANGLNPAEFHVIDTINDEYERAVILRESAYFTPTGIDVTSDGSKLFVISEATNSLLTVDIPNHQIVQTQTIYPRALKLSQNNPYLYVYSPQYPPANEGKFLIIDTESLEILETIDLGMIRETNIGDQRTFKIALNSSEKIAYLAGGNGDEVIVLEINSKQIKARIPIGEQSDRSIVPPRGIAITPDDRKIFVSSCLSRTVSVISTDTYTVIDTIHVSINPGKIEISPDGTKVFVLHSSGTDLVTIIDAETHNIIKIVDFPSGFSGLFDFFISPDQRYGYFIRFDPNWIMVYDFEEEDPRKVVIELIKTGLDPFNVAVSADNRFLYVTEYTSDRISIIDTQTNQIIDTIPLIKPDETSVQVREEIPREFKLNQNYPNPFNPETTIKYQLPKVSEVNISIYNILGQKIKTLVNEEKQPGSYYVKWDGTNDYGIKVSSGIYIYRLETNNGFVKARKLVFLK